MVPKYAVKSCGNAHNVCRVCKPDFWKRSEDSRTERHRLKRIAKKQKAIEDRGAACERCSYNRCIKALHFHHPESDKDFGLAQNWHRSWEVLQEELAKCLLLCANCHHEVHEESFGVNTKYQ